MSLKQEERDIMVALELEKADSTFAEHEGLTEKVLGSTDTPYPLVDFGISEPRVDDERSC